MQMLGGTNIFFHLKVQLPHLKFKTTLKGHTRFQTLGGPFFITALLSLRQEALSKTALQPEVS